jgi:GNAT superfamily N-acetyltransferase
LPTLDDTGMMAPFRSGVQYRGLTSRERFAHARDVLRQAGPRGLWFTVLARFFYRRYYLYEVRLDPVSATLSASVPVAFEEVKADRSGEFRQFWPEVGPAFLEHCFEAGYRCFVARSADRPIAMSWAADDRIWSDFLECQMPLAEDEVYGFATYVLPEARGKGVAGALLSYRARSLTESGYRRLFHLVEPERITRLVGKLDDRLVAVIGHYRFGRRRWLFCRSRAGFAPPGGP